MNQSQTPETGPCVCTRRCRERAKLPTLVRRKKLYVKSRTATVPVDSTLVSRVVVPRDNQSREGL